MEELSQPKLKSSRLDQWLQLLKPRDSAPLRILTGTAFCTLIGSYTGTILQELQFRDSDKTLKNSPAKRFRRGWMGVSFTASLAFFCLNEIAHQYFEKSKIYHNFFIDNSIAGLAVYSVLHRWMRKQQLISHLTTLQVQQRAQKYSLLLCCFGLLFDLYIQFRRKQLILQSLTHEGTCPFILSEADLELLSIIANAKQLTLWKFGKAEEGEIGSFVPLAVMQEIKKTEVETANQEVNKRLSQAIKRLVEIQTRESMQKIDRRSE